MLKNSIFVLWILLLGLTGCVRGCDPALSNKVSPDGSKTLMPSLINNLVVFKVCDNEGNEILSVNTRASDFQKWSLEWESSTSIVLKSSDIGTYTWRQQKNGTWQKFGKLPDGTWEKESSSD